MPTNYILANGIMISVSGLKYIFLISITRRVDLTVPVCQFPITIDLPKKKSFTPTLTPTNFKKS